MTAVAEKQILTPREAARLLGRSRSFIEKHVQGGAIPARRLGGRWFLTVADLRAAGWLDSSASITQPQVSGD